MEIYAMVKPSGRERALPAVLPAFTSTLHAHQRRAAAWMVDRETGAAAVRCCPLPACLRAHQVGGAGGPLPRLLMPPADKPDHALLATVPFPLHDAKTRVVGHCDSTCGTGTSHLACLLSIFCT